MKLRHISPVFVLPFLTTGFLLSQAPRDQGKASVDTAVMTKSAIDCTGTVKACNKPVKFLTKTPSCICFTCGYGTSDAKQLCTKTSNEADAFAKLARQSGFADDEMDKAVARITTQEKHKDQPHEARHVEDETKKGPGL